MLLSCTSSQREKKISTSVVLVCVTNPPGSTGLERVEVQAQREAQSDRCYQPLTCTVLWRQSVPRVKTRGLVRAGGGRQVPRT